QEKPPLPFVLGREAAGEVVAVGPGVPDARVGQHVFALTGTGAFAEQATAPADLAQAMPEGMPFDAAAALPIVYPTSYAGLVFRGALQSGETLLVHAAAGATGLAAVQIGKALGARVIATAGGADKVAVARDAGADVCVDSRDADFVEVVKRETDGRGADVIFDPVGGDVFDRSLKCIAWNGRLVVVGFASGTIPEVKANRIMLKNIAVTGLHWPAYREHEPDKMAEAFRGCAELYATGAIEPVIGMRVPLERVGEALVALDERRTVGKVIVEI
ncbi:MAG: NADPH:quinone oxidoreductase family protein, partial [Actinomycetota bacterium]|nr:NADPH:quinone oxidoreductase family protein [Actinomycetota bacterium]